MAPIICVEHLRKVYRVGKEKVIALNDVNLSIEPGEICCIVGPSGSGKSTLLNQLAGLEKPTKGSVHIGKHEISAMNENQLAKFRQAHLGFIFQSYNLLPNLTAAENVAMQAIPMIKTMQFSNMNLVRKINSAFIVTLPVFKQALAQAILLKRQKIQAESIAELDKKTNEMLLKNAQNTVDVSKMTAKMASGSSIQIETLEKTWATITNGIEETRRIQEDARKKRQEDQVRLEAIKQDFNKQYNVPPVRK